MAIIGEEIPIYTAGQINARQVLHGSGAGQSLANVKNDQQIALLNSNTSWIKLASGVSVEAFKLAEIGLPSSLSGMELAKKYILYAGFSKLEDGNRLVQREGFLPQNANSSYSYGTYGYSPMPGIISADVKSLNRGSIKKATVKMKIHNKEQFNIIDLLYFRLGYTVLLEWGNSIYTPNGKVKETIRGTLIDNPDWFFNSKFGGSNSYRDILGPVESYRRKYAGNYDGLLGKVSNFNWQFNEDGSYDAEITIVSLGDVIESLKTNVSTDKSLASWIIATSAATLIATPVEGEETDIIEENKDSNTISSMLWVWKWANIDNLKYFSYDRSVFIKLGDGTECFVGSFLSTTGPTLTAVTKKVKWYYLAKRSGGDVARVIRTSYPDIYPQYQSYIENVLVNTIDLLEDRRRQKQNSLGSKAKFTRTETYRSPDVEGLGETQYDVEVEYDVIIKYKVLKDTKKSITDSPIKDFSNKDAFFLVTSPTQFYLRLGALLDFIADNVIPKVDTNVPYDDKPPMFEIERDVDNNLIYSLPNQISLDPRVCLIRNDSFKKQVGTATVFHHLEPFRVKDNGGSNFNQAYLMNVYLNFTFIIECLNSTADERGDTNIYEFLRAICDGLNKSLGGINNLEPIIKEEDNTLRIIDTTPIPDVEKAAQRYTLQLYGYSKRTSSYSSNFVRKVDLKTAITPEYATMVTVGATAGGYVKGTEATAFSRWNKGLIDRFKEKFTPGNENSLPENGVDEAVINYNEKMLSPLKSLGACYGFSGNLRGGNDKNLKISPDSIETNLSVGTEYFKYLVSSQPTQQGGTIGFIPFKVSFSMDGISGIKIYNVLHVDSRFLPKAYGDTLDLIVTGINHRLANSDWETEIEATVIPKTTQTDQVIITAPTTQEPTFTPPNNSSVVENVSNCSGIPASNVSRSLRKAVKASDNTNSKAISYVLKLEGGYFHPVHAYFSNGTLNPNYDYRRPNCPTCGNSGETLWGIDRANGRHEFDNNNPTIKNAAIKFWRELDQLTGYGSYKAKSQTTKKYQWPYNSYPRKAGGKAHYWDPGFTPGTTLAENARIILEERFNIYMNTHFSGHPLYNIIKSDGRLLFLYWRARWNGPGFFKNFANNLKRHYNNGETNIDKLICLDLTYRYNYSSMVEWKNGISKIKDMIDFNP